MDLRKTYGKKKRRSKMRSNYTIRLKSPRGEKEIKFRTSLLMANKVFNSLVFALVESEFTEIGIWVGKEHMHKLNGAKLGRACHV